jgi:adenine-specific DNA-methyltransferase
MPSLDFKGKQFVYAHHLSVPFRQLDIDAKKSLPTKGGNPGLNHNLIIHGDNLHALKALLPKYAGKVKCIYIDPPYNTGNEGWCYNDSVNAPLMKEWLKDSANPVDKEDLERHDKWLCMMWPRLQLLRELLADDGVIFVSIGDDEHVRLKNIMDEVFGEDHYITSIVWKSRQIVDSRPLNGVSNDHEYVVTYGKSRSALFLGKESNPDKYSNPDNDPRGPWMSNSILGLATREQRPNLHYALVDPATGIKYLCPESTGWRYSKETMDQKIKESRIVFPKKEGGRPREKKFLQELAKITTGFSSILNSDDVGYTLHGTREVREIFDENIFPFPKPHILIKTLLKQVTDGNSIVLDSFSGSGTTAHAVLALNKEDGGNRKFILVECEDYADTITAERVRRVIKGVPGAKDDSLKNGLGGSFTFCKLGQEINIDNLLKGEQLPDYNELAQYAFYTATGQTLDKVKQDADYFIGETDQYRVHVLYKPDVVFLRSGESALNADLAASISKSRGRKTALVFATHKFMGQKELTEMGVTYCQLPYAIHRVIGD